MPTKFIEVVENNTGEIKPKPVGEDSVAITNFERQFKALSAKLPTGEAARAFLNSIVEERAHRVASNPAQ